MKKYHVNPKTGNPDLCHATVRGCPLGIVAAAHVSSREECRWQYENVMSDSLLPRRAKRETARRVWRLSPAEEHEVYSVKIPAMHAYHALAAS